VQAYWPETLGKVFLLGGLPAAGASAAIGWDTARAAFTGEEVAVDASAVLKGEPTATLLVLNHRAYTIRVRFPDESRLTLDRMSNTLLVSVSGRTAGYRS
jgi:hypothetical protein